MAVEYVLMCFKCKICFTVYTGEPKVNDTCNKQMRGQAKLSAMTEKGLNTANQYVAGGKLL